MIEKVMYNITVCPVGTTINCFVSTTNMPRHTAVNLVSGAEYVITVHRVINLPSGPCVSRGCHNNTARGRAFPEGMLKIYIFS